MQTHETLQSLAVLDEDLIRQRCLGLCAAIEVQDLERCLSFFHPEGIFRLPGAELEWPLHGTHVGLEAIRRVWAEIIIRWEIVSQTVEDVIVDHDRAVVHRVIKVRARGGGPTVVMAFCDFFRFQDGLIMELTGVFDATKATKLAES